MTMTWTPRRVVTGHDGQGKSVFLSDGAPPVARTEPDPAAGVVLIPPPRGGTKIRINEFPPGVVSPVHRTESVDYGIVVDGEMVLALDDSETVLRQGDVVVQRGTSHRWENRSGQVARMVFVLVDAAFTPGLTEILGGDAEKSQVPDIP
jgi:quercetin dioxygenase-like cupin family protein